MEQVFDNLNVGDESACVQTSGMAVVHACKHPCHQNEVGYTGSLPQDHPEYLVAARDSDLYLNIVDMDRKLSHEYTEPIVSAALDFMDEHGADREVLVHCNKGQSRSPALAMLFLAKRRNAIPDASYSEAKQDFSERYPGFRPGRGVDAYLREYWQQLD